MSTGTEHITEAPREIPVLTETDVVVCGGGPSGCAAAISAARHGARTVLLEKEGYLGGSPATQLVCVILSTNGVDFQGVWHELIRGLRKRDGVRPFSGPGKNAQIRSCVDPEMLKHTWDELLNEAGVQLLHHAYGATGIVADGEIRGVFVETRAGRRAILARRVIDCTGDGIVAAQAGVPWEQGEGGHKYAMACTKVFRLGNVQRPEDWDANSARAVFSDRLDGAIKRGEFDAPVVVEKERLLGYYRSWCWELPARRREILSVISRVLKVDPLDPIDFTRAEREGRDQAWQAAEALRKYAPGFENTYLVDTSNQIGVRSSRRLQGLATVTRQDALEFVKYEDSIARSSWEIDIWPADSYKAPAVDRSTEEWRERKDRMLNGEYFDIRYGCIVAEGIDNLLMGGRCISAEHEAESSLRIQQTCMSTGQAAGTAAAMSLRQKLTPRELEPMEVVRQLEKDRALVTPAWPE